MKRCCYLVLPLLLLLGSGWLQCGVAEPEKKAFEFRPPVTERPVFGETLTMLAQERGDYSKNLARYATNLVKRKEANPESLALARRFLAVALHLTPRSREALVATFQLKSGVLIEEEKPMDYSPEVFARLLLTRADLLGKQGADGEKLLARCFIELAAQMDPRNEDAVYAFQIQALDHGELNWNEITDASLNPAPGVSRK